MPSTIRRSGPVSPAVELVAAVREGYHPRQAGTVVRFGLEPGRVQVLACSRLSGFPGISPSQFFIDQLPSLHESCTRLPSTFAHRFCGH